MWNNFGVSLPSANFYGSRGGQVQHFQGIGQHGLQQGFQQGFQQPFGTFGALNSSVSNVQFGGRQALWGSVGGGYQQGQLIRGQLTNSIGRPMQQNQLQGFNQFNQFGQNQGFRGTFQQQQNNFNQLPYYQNNLQGFGSLQNSISAVPNTYSPYKQQYPVYNQTAYGTLTGSRGYPQGFQLSNQNEFPVFYGQQWGQLQNSISRLPQQNFYSGQNGNFSGRKMNQEPFEFYNQQHQHQNHNQNQFYGQRNQGFQNFGQQPEMWNFNQMPPQQKPPQQQYPQFNYEQPQIFENGLTFADPKLNKMYQEFKASNSNNKPKFDHPQPPQNFGMPPPFYGPSSGSKGQPWGGNEGEWQPNPFEIQSKPVPSFIPPEKVISKTPAPSQTKKEKFETPEKTIQTLDAYQQLCNQYANNM